MSFKKGWYERTRDWFKQRYDKFRDWASIEKRASRQLEKSVSQLERSDYLEWFAQSPGYAPLVTLSVAALGIIASVQPQMVQSSFGNLPVLTGDSFSWGATGFWLLFILSALLFWGRRAAENRADRRDREVRRELIADQEAAVEKLRDDLRTMPPDPFLNHYYGTYEHIHSSYAPAIDAVKRGGASYKVKSELIREVIQTALMGLATLARRFDEDDEDRYAANCMVYVKSSAISDAQEEDVNARPKHVPKDVGVKQLRGFLDFRQDLSVVSGEQSEMRQLEGSSTNENHIDENHPSVCYGIPIEHLRDVEGKPEPSRKWRIGPGAPHTLLTGDPGLFENTDAIETWMRENTTLGVEPRTDTMRYIEDDAEPRIGSFLSLPLSMSESGPSECDHFLDPRLPIGVVNIHRSRPGLLRGRDKSLKYYHITALSILSILSDLLKAMAILENNEHRIWSHLAD